MQKNKKGFTLIELLVVIAIIGLLSTLSILALNSSRARARDAKRLSDVKQIQTALELYYNTVGDYPASLTPGTAVAYNGNTYLAAIPSAPSPVDGDNCAALSAEMQTTYKYTTSGTAAGGEMYALNYCLGATVNSVGGNMLQTASPAGIK